MYNNLSLCSKSHKQFPSPKHCFQANDNNAFIDAGGVLNGASPLIIFD